ncbi:MAG: polynucleotide adenylyltransferase PcnB [Gammaproteobacteria bacterium]
MLKSHFTINTPSSLRNIKTDTLALEILQILEKHNFQAFLVGGCVRDALVNLTPKDFDIATNATPEQIRKIFKASRIIGKRFKLVHVFQKQKIIEVSTFRSSKVNLDDDDQEILKDQQGKIVRDNSWGTIEEDCERRDFTVNALYYNPVSNLLFDPHDGVAHSKQKILVSIGNPLRRFEEDPVRSLRAIRFATKLGFKIHNDVKEAIYQKGHLLNSVSTARMFDEFNKLFLQGRAKDNYLKLDEFGLSKYLFSSKTGEQNSFQREMIMRSLENTDDRVNNNQSVTAGFLLAAILWPKLAKLSSDDEEINLNKFYRNMDFCIGHQMSLTSVPKRFYAYIKDIWTLQIKLQSRLGKQPMKLVAHPRFRAAFDLLVLREQCLSENVGLTDWWLRFQNGSRAQKAHMLDTLYESRKETNYKKFGFSEEIR